MQAHRMTRETNSNGPEIWSCPTCGRTVWVVWNPFSKRTLVAGNELAMHTAGTGVVLDVGTIDDGEMSEALKDALDGVNLGDG